MVLACNSAASGYSRNQSSGSKISSSANASSPELSSKISTRAYKGNSLHASRTPFEKVISFFDRYVQDATHPYHKSAKDFVERLESYPELKEGFTDFSLIDDPEYGQIRCSGLYPRS